MGYSGDPSASTLDEVRFLISDTDNANLLLSDTEISYVIGKLGSTYSDALMFAAYCADRIAAKYASEVAITADGVTYSGEQLQDKYTAMAATLREEYSRFGGVGAAPFAGGSLIGDRVWGARPLNFGVGMDDNNRAGSQRFGHREDCDDWTQEGW